ncbi:aquaporin [Neotabrizicola sp. VNH66]|uniref:aquaporin n=1 Tax=Neotabrizicola sp. VNH66 TaxID=3400918 RepID=UPI003BFB188F
MTSREIVAEGLGTALLVAVVVGSGIMADRLSPDHGVALLANTLATAAILVVLIMTLGPVSGAHMNPAVSLVFLLRRALSLPDALIRIAVQLAGGMAGTLLAHGMFDMALIQTAATVRTGAAQWLSEGVATFGLVMTVLGAQRHRPDAVAPLVGLYIAAAYWFTASTSFANPAVTLARSLTDTFAGIRPLDVPGFVLAQLAGAAAGAVLAGWLFADDAKGAKI